MVDLSVPEVTRVIRVLHVDDDSSLLEISKLLLMDLDSNFEIDQACCVDEGLRKLAAGHYDVVVSDYEMPQKDGLQFLTELRKQKSDIPFILFTGKGREEVAIKALNLGADGYLNKQGSPETVYGELSHSIKLVVERSRVKEALKERDIRFIKLAAQTPGMLFQFLRHPDGTFCVPFTSDGIKEIFGCSPQDVREDFSPIAKAIVPDDMEKVFQSIEHSAANLSLWQCEYRVQLPGKKMRWMWGQSTPERLEDGSILWSGYNTDITERKNAEETLRSTFEVLEKVGAGIDAGLAVIGKDYRVVWANKRLMDLGVTPNEKCYQTFNHSETICTDCGAKKIFNQNVLLDVHEFKTVDSKGETIWIELRVTPLKDKNGNVTAALELAVPITDRKKAEEALLQSEEKFRNVFSIAPNAVYLSTLKEGKMVEINDRFVEIFGYTRKEIIGQTSLQLGLWASPTERKKMLAILKSDGKIRNLEINCVRKNGQIFPAQFSVSILQQGDQQLLVGVIRDVSFFKQAEAALQASEAKYRSLADSLPEVVFETDSDGRLTYANLSAYTIFGYSQEEVAKGLFVFDLVHQKDRKKVKEDFRKTLSSGHIDNHEYTCIRKDGGTFPTMIVSKPFVDENGRVCLRGLVIDITQFKKVEETLRESEEKYRVTFESTGVASVIIEDDTTLSLVNSEYEKLSGYSKRELEGKKSWTEFVVKEDLDRMKEQHRLRRIDKNAASTHYDFRFIDRYGEIKNILLTIALIPGTKKSIASLLDITMNKKIEEALQKEQQMLTSIYANVSDVLYLLAVEHEDNFSFTSVNQSFLNVTGLKESQVVGKSVSKVIPEPSLSLVLEKYSQAIHEKRTVTWEEVTNYPGGRKYGEVSITPVFDSTGHCSNLIGSVHDITEIKQAEKKLLEEQYLIQKILDSTPNLVYIYDLINHCNVYANREILNFLGYTPKQIKALGSKLFTKILHPDDAQVVATHHARFANPPENVVFEVEYRMKHSSGEWRWLRSRDILFARTNEGIGKQILGTCEDITEAKKSAEILKLSERKYRELAESLPEIVFETDIDGRLIFVNQSASQMTGYGLDEFDKNFSFIRLLVPAEQEKAMMNFSNLKSSESKFSSEFNIIRKDGSVFSAIIWVTPIIINNKFSGLRGIVVDNSKYKRVEDRLKQAAYDFQLLNEKLRVVGGLTRHDVGNKLAVIGGNEFLLRKRIGKKPELSTYLDNIKSALDASDKLFEFSRFYEQIGSEKPAIIDVFESFNVAAALFPNLNKLTIINKCQRLKVVADSLLRQLFYNLIDNSLNHGEKITQIRLYYTKDEERVKLFYEDNGIGVPKANKSRLFDVGFTTGKGRGLGLALIKRIIEVYGWNIAEEGEPGRGAKFVISIPTNLIRC